MTGALFRVLRDGKWVNIELEYLTPQERKAILKDKDKDFLISCISLLCGCLKDELKDKPYK